MSSRYCVKMRSNEFRFMTLFILEYSVTRSESIQTYLEDPARVEPTLRYGERQLFELWLLSPISNMTHISMRNTLAALTHKANDALL